MIWVKFPVKAEGVRRADASVVIWTTTPWTIPANRAVSFNPEIAYGLYECDEPGGRASRSSRGSSRATSWSSPTSSPRA